ncbi:hypothetical protein QR680_005019 [Steinernema hermaphroditum]|uniref:Protein sleepless n=1 Tax=Steinernema hermaphroditum TaxID=289476 RepID=A0AA39LUM2_9BILA|nr:hypothetical protein QR680_005019 [Steinernema hermaphroditum]
MKEPILLVLLVLEVAVERVVGSWRDRHPQTRQDRYSFRMQCHSCMSPYLEDQFMYISHLYRKPLAFSEKCDHNNFDDRYVRTKNCSDLCITLRMNDRVGGRRRYGYMRGCMSDILHYNHSVVRTHSSCYLVRLRDLFVSSDRYGFDTSDTVQLCTCFDNLCNAAASLQWRSLLWLGVVYAILQRILWPDGLLGIPPLL